MARTLVVEADGASRGNPGPASYGALVADAITGEVLVELAEPLGVTTNNVAEYRGLIAGLRAAHALDPHAEVEVRMDSKLAVQQMSGLWQIRHPAIRLLAAEARTAFPRAEAVRYTWVPRAENKRADALGNLALDDPAAAAAKVVEAAAMMEAFRAARGEAGQEALAGVESEVGSGAEAAALPSVGGAVGLAGETTSSASGSAPGRT